MKLSRWASISLWALAFAGLSLSAPPVLTAGPTWDIVQLTHDAHQHLQAAVSGDRVGWIGSDGTCYQVFTQEMGVDAAPSQVTSGAVDSTYVDVSGDRLVWQHNDGSSWQIYTQKMGVEGSPVQLTAGPNYQVHPLVSGDRVMWEGSDGAADQVYTQKVGVEPTPIALTSDTFGHGYYHLSGDRVAWRGYDGMHYQIYTAKMGTGWAPVRLTTDALGYTDPQVSGDRVVWTDEANHRIHTRKIGVDAGATTLPYGPVDQVHVSGDRIVWRQRLGSVNQILTFEVGVDSQPTQLTSGAWDSGNPGVDGDRVVWQSYDGASWQILTREMGVDSAPSQLTSAALDSESPRVSGSRVVWLGTDAEGLRQIFEASVVVAPTAIALTSGSASSLSYGGAFLVRGVLSTNGGGLAQRDVVLEAAAPAGSYGVIASALTSDDGSFVFSVRPQTKTYYRVRFAGASGYAASGPTDSVYAVPRPSVYTPVAPSSMYRTRYYTVFGYLKPRHAAGSYPVRIYKDRYVSGKWRSYGYVTAKASNYSSYSKYARSVKLPYRGRWRLRAYAPADSGHAAVWSKTFDYVTVR